MDTIMQEALNELATINPLTLGIGLWFTAVPQAVLNPQDADARYHWYGFEPIERGN